MNTKKAKVQGLSLCLGSIGKELIMDVLEKDLEKITIDPIKEYVQMSKFFNGEKSSSENRQDTSTWVIRGVPRSGKIYSTKSKIL